jgi:enamine deaminase RidA (YjgF/YER057c/UK114 family)
VLHDDPLNAIALPERVTYRLEHFGDDMRNSVPAGSPWGDIVGYSRAVRVGNQVYVSGTTAGGPDGRALNPGDPAAQTRIILERIDAALVALGATMQDVVETRIYVRDITRWEEVGRVHGEIFGAVRPATSMIEVGGLISPDLLVEISAIAVVDSSGNAGQDRPLANRRHDHR